MKSLPQQQVYFMFDTLISTDDLHAHLSDPNWLIFDCRFTLSNKQAGREAYEKGHITGAQYVDLEQEMSGEITAHSGRHPLPPIAEVAAKFGQWGIDGNKQVVVYDDIFGAIAGRLWWLLKWLGHDRVALLDGGYPKWLREDKPVDTEEPASSSTVFTPQPRNHMLVDTETVAACHTDAAYLIIDARAEERFDGDVEPLDKVAGHIPNSVNHPFDENLELGGTFLTPEELRPMYQNLLGDRSPDHIILSCGSGVTACHNMIAMEHAGFKGAKLYVGSWSAWITDPARPIASNRTTTG